MDKPSEIIRREARRQKTLTGKGGRELEAHLGLKPWSLRGILDSKRPQIPSVDRAAALCRALGLEFYVGPPRAEDPAIGVPETLDFGALIDALERHWEALGNAYARQNWLAHLRRAFPELSLPAEGPPRV